MPTFSHSLAWLSSDNRFLKIGIGELKLRTTGSELVFFSTCFHTTTFRLLWAFSLEEFENLGRELVSQRELCPGMPNAHFSVAQKRRFLNLSRRSPGRPRVLNAKCTESQNPHNIAFYKLRKGRFRLTASVFLEFWYLSYWNGLAYILILGCILEFNSSSQLPGTSKIILLRLAWEKVEQRLR